MADFDSPVERVPSDCFIADSFAFGPCPCGCGGFKLMGRDAAGVVRALIAIGPGQLAQMATFLCPRAPQEPSDEEGAKH